MNKSNTIHCRLNDEELDKLNELSERTNMSKSDLLRNLIMTADSNSKDKLSIEILQWQYMIIRFLSGTMKELLPGKITQKWIDGIIAEAKKRYPID
jgi:hypothetical protein